MTKLEMLRGMLNDSEFRAVSNQYMNLRKDVIEEAFWLYNNRSHTCAKKFLKDCYLYRGNRIRWRL